MLSPSTITAVCGWAIPPGWFKNLIQNQFPESKIKVIYPKFPSDANEAKDLLSKQQSDLILGYSLGSLWLLYHNNYLSTYKIKALLAPIFGFSKEIGLGGKTSKAQLNFLIKLLSKNSENFYILKTFYQISGLIIPENTCKELCDNSVLIRGLEFLKAIKVDPIIGSDFVALIGENDHLIEWKEIKRHLPHLEVIHRTGHSPEPLLEGLSNTLKKQSNF